MQESLQQMTMQKSALVVLFILGVCVKINHCFVVVPSNPSRSATSELHNDKFNADINERSRQRAASDNKGAGSMATGAILGGMLGGPFGMLFGASIGSKLGGKNALDKARKEEMERSGISQDMLDAAEDVGLALQQSMEGMEATQESLRSQQSLARRIDADSNETYEKAKEAMVGGREEEAKTYLLERNKNQESLKSVLKRCAEEKERISIMEKNVSALQKRALEVEAMLTRAAGAKARQGSFDFTLSVEDPLLKKFQDAGID